MKSNKLGFLSLLALLGVLGLITNRPLSGFFGFAYYIRYFFVIPDELFMENVRKAASMGFFSGVAAVGLAAAIHVLLPDVLSGTAVVAASYVVSVFVFTIALLVYEVKEQRGC